MFGLSESAFPGPSVSQAKRARNLKTAPLSRSYDRSFVYFRALIGCHFSNIASVSRCYANSYSGLCVSNEMHRQYHAPSLLDLNQHGVLIT